MKTFILSLTLLAAFATSASGQTLLGQRDNTGFFTLEKAKVDLTYTATSKQGFKFNWNSNHLGTDLNNPLSYKYRTDYGFKFSKGSNLSVFAEGNAKLENANLGYDRAKNIGLNYGYSARSLTLNLQYSQKVSRAGEPNQVNDKSLKLDISSRL